MRDELERLPEQLRGLFVPLADARDDTVGRHGVALTLARKVLGTVLSDYDANGLLRAYPMKLLSTDEWTLLLGPAAHGRLLDVGAGAGWVTAALAPLFDEVVTTETSRAMAWRLAERGWTSHRVDLVREPLPDAAPFDVVTCLHVLDRCARPLTLVDRLRERVRDDGRVVVAVTFPYAPHVHVGASTVDPDELLPCTGASWTSDLVALVERVLEPRGLEVERFTRAPYVSAGDSSVERYVLDSAIVVCRPVARR